MYFDLHLHPSTKSFLSGVSPFQPHDCWKQYEHIIDIIKSQCSLGQLFDGGVRLIVAAIYPLERPFTHSFLLEHIAPIITPIDPGALQFPTHSDYYSRMTRELEHLERSILKAPKGRPVQIISCIDDFDPVKLNIILSVEGGHTLDEVNHSMEESLRKLKNHQYRFLYLTFTHLTQFPLCTHAYGMKLLGNVKEFQPSGFGLAEEGKKVIDLAYDTHSGHRILLDIKHMSIGSRKQFYQYRREKGYDNIPILATHMGCTGISWEPEIVKEYMANDERLAKDIKKKKIGQYGEVIEVQYAKKPRGIGWGLPRNHTYFNPWSVNLYDEEIGLILDSGGLIGVNMDKRILGVQKVKGEFFSVEEFKDLLGIKSPTMPIDFSIYPDLTQEKGREGSRSVQDGIDPQMRANYEKHLRHLANNILHIVKVGGERAWKHICLGSDFDGMIAPVDNCVSAAEYPLLAQELPRILRSMIDEARKKDPKLNFHEGDLKDRVKDFMFDNAIDFLKKHFS